MQLPSFKQLFTQDFPKEYQKLINQLSLSLNNGIQVLYNTLNKNVSLNDNISCIVKDVTIIVDSTGKPTTTSAFAIDKNVTVQGLEVILATNQTNSTHYPVSHPFISGSQNNTTYNISNISGLQAGETYILRVVAYYD